MSPPTSSQHSARPFPALLATPPNLHPPHSLNPEFSQAILAGTVPVVLGAPNVDAFAPVRDAFINARDFDSVQQLVGFLEDISANDAMYEEFFDWKQEHGGNLPPAFAQHLSHCAHLAECRLCEYVHRHT